MYRPFIFRWLPIRAFKRECVLQAVGCQNISLADWQWPRHLTISNVYYKKRKSVEERAVENQGRRVIRYSPKAGTEVVGIWRNMTVQDIAEVLNKDLDHILKALEFADKTHTVQRSATAVVHDPNVTRDLVKLCGARYRLVAPPGSAKDEDENKDAVPAPPAPPEALRPRPAVVCVMGHVDHGKTTLLDALRDSALVDKEFGGITQHIGAFEVSMGGSTVTFLDTPGHAAFAAMRARGARGADVVALVVAADDGAMDQTAESLRMAREADVPVLVVVNKIDKPGANIERTLQSLARLGVVAESLGGDVQAVAVSALKRQGLDTLVDALALQAQIMDLKADPTGYVEGVVLEAQLDTKTGKQATVLVQRGTLRRGAVLVAGNAWAKVRVLQSAEGGVRSEARPGTAAAVLGWRELPAAGDLVLEVPNEQRAHAVLRYRSAGEMRSRQAAAAAAIQAKEDIHRVEYEAQLARKRAAGRMRMRREGPREKMLKEDTHPTLRVVVKGDVDGSVEAILDMLDTYADHGRVRLDLVHYGLGPLAPGDVEIAEAFNAVVYLFNVGAAPGAAAAARAKAVTVKEHNVIYRLAEDVKQEINNRIPKRQEEEFVGEANVLQQFFVSEGRRRLPVAGARCVKGKLQRDLLYRVIRDGEVIYEGKLASMKHLKEEVSTIKNDTECGLRFADAELQLRPGDRAVCYRLVDTSDTTAWDPGF